jgi:hypothetical protein
VVDTVMDAGSNPIALLLTAAVTSVAVAGVVLVEPRTAANLVPSLASIGIMLYHQTSLPISNKPKIIIMETVKTRAPSISALPRWLFRRLARGFRLLLIGPSPRTLLKGVPRRG